MDNKKHWEILIEGDGRGNYPTHKVDVYCTEEELNTIATAMIMYVSKFTDGGCCCLAKQGGGVSVWDSDIVFCDCM